MYPVSRIGHDVADAGNSKEEEVGIYVLRYTVALAVVVGLVFAARALGCF